MSITEILMFLTVTPLLICMWGLTIAGIIFAWKLWKSNKP